jgi:hypothetical protein
VGLGFYLLERAVDELHAASNARIKARILANHPSVERLYDRLGFREVKTFRLHGRAWKVLQS